jgi:hypothetical protein
MGTTGGWALLESKMWAPSRGEYPPLLYLASDLGRRRDADRRDDESPSSALPGGLRGEATNHLFHAF